MPSSDFFDINGDIKLSEIEKITGAKLVDKSNSDKIISGLAGLENATPKDIIFLSIGAVADELVRTQYIDMAKSIKAGACITSEEHKDILPKNVAVLIADNPKGAFIKLTNFFYKDKNKSKKGIEPSAVVSDSVKFKDKNSCYIGHNAVIEDNVTLGKNCYIASGAVIKTGCKLGDNCYIRENAVIGYTVMGNNCSVGENTTIGGTGFGWHSGPWGHTRVPQIGRVLMGNNVEVDGNTCIDRGAVDDTVIGDGTKIDNLVQMAHNNKVGKHCIIAGQSGFAGSNKIQDWCLFGAQSGTSGFLTIGTGSQVGGKSGVINDLEPKSKVVGFPAVPKMEYFKQVAMLRKLIKKKKK